MRITIADELADKYAAYGREANLSVDAIAERQLARFQDVHPTGPAIVLGRDHLDQLADKLHGGQLRTAADLTAKVLRLAAIRFESMDLQLTPAQLEELVARAEKQNRPLADLVREVYDRVVADLFHSTGTLV